MLLAISVGLFIIGYLTALLRVHRSKSPLKDGNAIEDRISKIIGRLRSGSGRAATSDIAAGIKDVAANSVKPQTTSGKSDLLTRDDIEKYEYFEASSWQKLAYDDFTRTILGKDSGGKTFPCVYGTMGFRSNDHRYIFLESDDPAEPRNLRKIAPALKEYLDISTTLGPNTSLVIIGGTSSSVKTVTDYNNSFWDMLRGLRIIDTKPWPTDIPQDTESEKWTFCFDGQPLFPVMLTPAHQQRWSRHMSVPVIALQPKWVLDNLLGTPEKREAAQSKVRKLLVEYDQIKISPDLTSYGQPGTSEVRQLCLLDENETALCKYKNFDQ